MLSLGPGSSCDVCLEAFNNDLKAPCSISCGHVFCCECLNRITRQACPLCRVHFDPRTAIKLHVDLDGIRPAASNGDSSSDPLTAGQEARILQERIAAVANVGTTEPGLRQLISDCKTFLSSQPRHMFQDLRVSLRMIAYLCEVKSKLRSQNQEVDSLKEKIAKMQQTIENLDRRVEDVNIIRKEEKAYALERELELTRAFSEMQTKCIEAKEQLQQQKSENESLQKELKRLRSGSGTFYQDPPFHHHQQADSLASSVERRSSRSELRGLTPPEQNFMISPLPEFTSNALAADTFANLPDVEESSEDGATEYAGGCGAAGCPHSCSCQPVSLFSPEERHSSPTQPDSSPMPQTTPSLLTLTAPRGDDSGPSQRSIRSHSFSSVPPSASNAPTRPASPTSYGPSEEQMMIPNPTERNHILRYHLHDLLTDTPPDTSSSLPNFGGRHFPRGEAGTPPGLGDSPPPRRPAPSRSHSSSLASLSPQPISIPMAQPTVSLTPASSVSSQGPLATRPALSRASSHAVALENAQREKRREDKERQRSETEKRREREGVVESPNYSPKSASLASTNPHSGVNGSRSSSSQKYSAPAGDTERSSRTSPPPPPPSSRTDSSRSSSRPHGQREPEPMAIYSGSTNTSGRSMSTPIKAGVSSSSSGRVSRDSYQYSTASIGSAKAKLLAATMAANTSVAGFA